MSGADSTEQTQVQSCCLEEKAQRLKKCPVLTDVIVSRHRIQKVRQRTVLSVELTRETGQAGRKKNKGFRQKQV